jgi:hypothetical protein
MKWPPILPRSSAIEADSTARWTCHVSRSMVEHGVQSLETLVLCIPSLNGLLAPQCSNSSSPALRNKEYVFHDLGTTMTKPSRPRVRRTR